VRVDVPDDDVAQHPGQALLSQPPAREVYRSLESFRQDAQLTSWLYRIVMNACIDHRRRKSPAASTPFAEEAGQRLLNTPEEFRTMLESETLRWGKVVKAAGIKPE